MQETKEVQKNSKYNKHDIVILRKFIPKEKKKKGMTLDNAIIPNPLKYFYKYFTKCIFPC